MPCHDHDHTIGLEPLPADLEADLVERSDMVRAGQPKAASGMSRSSRWAA